MEFEIQPSYTVEDFAAFWYGFRDKRAGKPVGWVHGERERGGARI